MELNSQGSLYSRLAIGVKTIAIAGRVRTELC